MRFIIILLSLFIRITVPFFSLSFSFWFILYPRRRKQIKNQKLETKHGGDIFTDSYIVPQTRIGTYAVGIATFLIFDWISSDYPNFQLSKNMEWILKFLGCFTNPFFLRYI